MKEQYQRLYFELTIRLARNDSEQQLDELRDEMDEPWYGMTELERREVCLWTHKFTKL